MLFGRAIRILCVAGLLGGLASLSGAAPSVGAAAAPTLVLVSQSATVTPSAPGEPATFSLLVAVEGSAPANDTIKLAFYRSLGSRGAFEQSLNSAADAMPTSLLHQVGPLPLSSLPSVGGGLEIATTVVPTVQPAGSSTVGLECQPSPDECSGVYPVIADLVAGDGTVLSHFTTYLTYAESKSPNPLVFSWVVPFAAPVQQPADDRRAVSVKPSLAGELTTLVDELAANPTLQASVAPSPATVEALAASSQPRDRQALDALHTLVASDTRRVLLEPYVPVNLSALSAAGLGTEIAGQMARAATVMTEDLRDDQASRTVWVAQGAVGPSITAGLAQAGATELVLPDSDLPQATEEYHATWAQTFELETGRGDVEAAASDSQLASYFTEEPGDPALGAYHLLADLAMIHFELPGVSEPRGVIAVPPANWAPSPGFVDALLSGLAGNPIVTTATLSQFFDTVPAGANGAVATRHLLSDGNGQIGARQAATIVAARKEITGFKDALVGVPPIENRLEDILLASESSDLSPRGQQATLADFDRQLNRALSAISVITTTVTLTARTASLPITIASSASFKLNAILTVSSAKLQFPDGASRRIAIDHSTNSTNVEVRALTSGDLPLSFTLTSPGGGLVITRGRLTVRSTATSIVGIVLTLAAAVVLIGWWVRTWRRGRRLRAARVRGTR